MVTKGIITSVDFNGNTCQVRIPLFESAGNDPITGTAIVSNTPGSYNGYKVGDVVLVAFEDGKMQNPVIVGKLYLGAAKEKQDPRGTINVETTTASKSASLPADAVLTANVDSNVPNTNTPFGSLASIANNLNSLNTDVNQLDRFTRNQFNSVITDVNDQGEQLRSEIKQTADNIEANVVHKHQDGSQEALGWDLTTDSWKINAQDTINGEVKDINIVTIDRGGMSIAGDLKLNGYPKNITVLYAQNDSAEDYPDLYSFKEALFPITSIDKTWYYGKYIKITDAGKEKYVLISKENFEQYTITVGTTIAYNREISSKWSTEVPKRVDGKYIWQWTRTEAYSFDKNNDVWIEKDDDRIVCITGARGETGTSVSECKTYYSLSNLSGGPEANDDNIASTPKVNKWSTSPQAFDKTLHQNYIYWTVERRVYTDPARIIWGTPVKASMLSVDFIDSLGITAEKITIKDKDQNVVFMADATSTIEGENIKLGNFNVSKNSIKNGTLGTENSVLVSTGSTENASIGTSGDLTGWAFAAGANFGVTNIGNLYASAGKIGGWTINKDQLSADLSRAGISNTITLKPDSIKLEGLSTSTDFSTKQAESFYLGIDSTGGNIGLGVFGSKMTRIFSKDPAGGWENILKAEVPGIIPHIPSYHYYQVPNLIIYVTDTMSGNTYDINLATWDPGIVKNIIGAVVINTNGKSPMGYKFTTNTFFKTSIQIQGSKDLEFFALIFCYATVNGKDASI